MIFLLWGEPAHHRLGIPLQLLRVMKLTAILLTVFFMQSYATGHGQEKITLSLKNASLKQVFRAIEKQTPYNFVYSSKTVEGSKSIDVEVRDADIEKVMAICISNQDLAYDIDDNIIVIKKKPKPAFTKQDSSLNTPIDVSGKVVNEEGVPVFATVTVKGTKNITTTNEEGKFYLKEVDENAILIITGVNIEPIEWRVDGRNELKITAKKRIIQDQEVIVSTGYYDVPKERATGSFVKIGNETFNQQTGTNILQRLDGITSGLLFDTKSPEQPRKTNISIRGLSTINGPLDPLIVLDGFVYEGDINNINPNDVESVSILKDAAAASIWGARAGNGVIVVNTKRGRFNQQLKVEFNSTVIITEKPDLHYLPQISSSDYIGLEQTLFNNGFFDGSINSLYQAGLTPAVEILLKRRNGTISSNDSAIQINALKSVDSRDQYLKYFYKKSFTQQYALNLRGGSGNVAWIVSGAYDKTIGSLDDRFDKLNFHFDNMYKPAKNFVLTLGVYYTGSKALSGKPAYNSISISNRNVPYLSFKDVDGNSKSIAYALRDSYTDTAGAGKLLDWKYYPLEDYKHDRTETNLDEIVATVGANYKLFTDLTVDIKYQFQKQRSLTERFSDLESFDARNSINLFTQLDRSSGSINYILPLGGILRTTNSTIRSQNIRGQLNYSKNWLFHNISAIAGAETREVITNGNSFTAYGYKNDPLSSGNVDYVNSYPTFITGNYSTISGAPGFFDLTNRFLSVYGNAAYTYKQKYTVSASGRRDGSNIFGINTNDRWKPLWSVGLAWNIGAENFYKIDWLPFLKIRATYGYSGNVDLSKTALPVGTINSPGINNFPWFRIENLNDPNLRWEQVATLNAGVDFGLRNSRLTGSLDFYKKRGSDLYGRTPYDYTAWGAQSFITRNVANMEGHGIDLVLNSKNIEKEFKWTSTLLFNYNVSKTTAYYTAEARQIGSLVGSDGNISPVIGKPLYAIAAYKWGGLDNMGNPQGFVNGEKSSDYYAIFDEAITKGIGGNIIFKGSATPLAFGSFINSFSWKGISLSANISYKLGYYFRKSTISYSQLISYGIGNEEFAKRWQKPGDELIMNVPSIDLNNDQNRDGFYALSEINVLRGDHIRLQYINLSYTLDKTTLKKALFPSIQIYANAANLGILWRQNKLKLDPEYRSSVPPSKIFSLGLRASF